MSDDGGQSPEPTELLPGGVGKRPEPEREADGGTLPMPAPQSRPDDETTELAPAATTSLGEGEGPGPERDAAPAPDGDKHRRRALAAVLAVALCLLLAAITYQAELWGGVSVPDVTGLTEAGATSALRDAGFDVSVMDVPTDSGAGTALYTNPQVGARARRGSTVELGVGVPRTVPSIVGLSLDDARSRLDDADITNLRLEYRNSGRRGGHGALVRSRRRLRRHGGRAGDARRGPALHRARRRGPFPGRGRQGS